MVVILAIWKNTRIHTKKKQNRETVFHGFNPAVVCVCFSTFFSHSSRSKILRSAESFLGPAPGSAFLSGVRWRPTKGEGSSFTALTTLFPKSTVGRVVLICRCERKGSVPTTTAERPIFFLRPLKWATWVPRGSAQHRKSCRNSKGRDTAMPKCESGHPCRTSWFPPPLCFVWNVLLKHFEKKQLLNSKSTGTEWSRCWLTQPGAWKKIWSSSM